ncbi:ABC transporter ATP-binding protein [Flavobacterium sp.]|uniref:ABC transporter ATP-binding protein n=1 Tax=Flavobacterium sp. TaxID=239 RepID=UPI002CC69527|nr:ATP-binding cassette domain-containing protein [Flavobacterium sp.]HSD06340.1 ATP-binding cassette domain-containing protein [Flavobacterium sp.]
MEAQPIIAINNLHKSFGKNAVLKGINLTLNKGENLVILGRSGSGKSVTIKCVVGLVVPDQGSIKISGQEITNLKYDELNSQRVKIGFMFQNGALYDSMSIRQNLKFTLKHHTRNLSDEAIEKEIIEALDNVGLKDSIDKMPAELSGGMLKRIALARAIIIKPEIILYDEPTAGLDTITSREISELIVSVQQKYKTSSIIITHDMPCAKITANRILILKEGEIIAEGTYDELEKSDDEWVRSFFV